jgi:hypothetical protein
MPSNPVIIRFIVSSTIDEAVGREFKSIEE